MWVVLDSWKGQEGRIEKKYISLWGRIESTVVELVGCGIRTDQDG